MFHNTSSPLPAGHLVACLIIAASMVEPSFVKGRQLQQTIQLTIPTNNGQVPQVFTVPSAPTTTFAPLLPASSSVPYAQPPTSTSDSMPTTGPQQPSQGPAPSAAGDPINDPVLQSVLDQHNMYRAAHQVGPLAWSASLAADAQAWAQRCVFQHSGPGECLAMGHATWTEAVNAWYIEVNQYNFAAGQYSPQTGHFTQMVWKATTQIGCGSAPGCKLYVCHYAPYGNVIGQFLENVFPAVRH